MPISEYAASSRCPIQDLPEVVHPRLEVEQMRDRMSIAFEINFHRGTPNVSWFNFLLGCIVRGYQKKSKNLIDAGPGCRELLQGPTSFEPNIIRQFGMTTGLRKVHNTELGVMVPAVHGLDGFL